jgi:hypothetical protein
MKRVLMMTALFAVTAVGAFAQGGNFSGTWTLAKDKSTMAQGGAGIESMTLAVTQTAEAMTVATTSKRAAQAAGGGRAVAGRGPGMMGGETTVIYSLDGKETTSSQESAVGNMETTVSAKAAGEGMELRSVRKMNSPAGAITLTTVENWTLSDEGRTLTIKREMDTPRGKMSSTLVFNRGS